jgi:hypothetical protein
LAVLIMIFLFKAYDESHIVLDKLII